MTSTHHASCQPQPRMRQATMVLVVALLALLALPVAHADWQAKEVAILTELRSWVGTIPERWPAARPDGTSSGEHHCQWRGVLCNADGRVTTVLVHDLGGDLVRDGRVSLSRALIPELAGLEALERLSITTSAPFADGIPAAWLRPGVFLCLKELSLMGARLGTPLPDFKPGLLPALEQLRLEFARQHDRLPDSWGRPDVLPRLQVLKVHLGSVPALPEGWAAGFRQLTNLHIMADNSVVVDESIRRCEPVEAGQARELQPHTLPAAWAHGFPKLRTLQLGSGAVGTIPPSWLAGFPSLTYLDLIANQLSGPLPSQLFSNSSKLNVVYLSRNCFTGALPDGYASSTVKVLSLDSNRLSGTAFPAAWLELDALPKLERLDLSNNRRLSGTLPANLSWPRLRTLNIVNTDVHGTIPAAWCQSPFANSMERFFLTHLEGGRTDMQLPACAEDAMPNLSVYADLYHPAAGTRSRPLAEGGASAAGHSSLRVAGIGVAALLAAVALAALGRMQRQRQQKQLGHPETAAVHREDKARLLDSLQPAARASSSAELSERTALCRQRRLAALLSKKPGPHSRTVDMVPLHALPSALTHRLVERERSVAGEGSSRAASWLGASGGANSIAPGQAPGQRWMLDTMSLQLQPEELEFVTDGHGRLVVLGEGAHAVVYHGRLQGCDVAIKVYEAAGSLDPALVWNEAAMLRSCTHPRIMPLYGISVEDNLIMLAMKHMEKGCLRDVLRQPDAAATLGWHNWGRSLALDVAEGLAFLHTSMHCLHADLKASNVLIDEEGRACLADLALAKVLASQAARSAAGATYTYAAPEQLMGQRCTLAADIFSLGVLLIEITTRTLSTKRGGWRLPRAPSECPQAVVELIMLCISLDPQCRPTAGQALQCLQAAFHDAAAGWPLAAP